MAFLFYKCVKTFSSYLSLHSLPYFGVHSIHECCTSYYPLWKGEFVSEWNLYKVMGVYFSWRKSADEFALCSFAPSQLDFKVKTFMNPIALGGLNKIVRPFVLYMSTIVVEFYMVIFSVFCRRCEWW